MKIKDGDIILFTGDSITDAGRRQLEGRHQLTAYSEMIFNQLNQRYKNLSAYNRGISGNTTGMLLERIENDLQDIKPTILSLLIGVNDLWNRVSDETEAIAMFSANYKAILDVASKYTSRIVVLEPFLFKGMGQEHHREMLNTERSIIKELANSYNAELIPLDQIFNNAILSNPPHDYSLDGVHLEFKGNQLLAESWLAKRE